MSELLPCPFCGSEAELRETVVSCNNCSACSDVYRVPGLAILFWNTRHIPEGYRLVPVDDLKELKVAIRQNWSTTAFKMLRKMIEGEV